MSQTRRRIVFAAGLWAGAAGCNAPPPTVALDLSVERTGTRVRLEGTTDLADGAILTYELRHEHLDVDPETPRQMLFREGTVEVADGRYDAEVDISAFEAGEIEVWLAFQMQFINSDRTQPAHIVRQFGEHGERLAGDNVSDLGDDGKRVELTASVRW